MQYVGQCVCDNDDMLLCEECFHRNTHMRVIYKYLPWKWAFFFVAAKWKILWNPCLLYVCVQVHPWRWIEMKFSNEYSRMSASMPIEKNIVMEMINAKKNCENRYFSSFPSNIYSILITLRIFFLNTIRTSIVAVFFFIHFHVNCNEPYWCNPPKFLSRLKCVLWKLKKHWHRCCSLWKYSLPKNLYHSLACTIHVNNDD